MRKIFLTSTLFMLLFSACKENPKPTAPVEDAKIKKDNVTTVVPVPVLEMNKISKNLLRGVWRSTIDAKNRLDLHDTTGVMMPYSVIYAGKKIEEGKWEVPADCKGCIPAAPDGCFFFKNDDGNDCCSIVKLTKDTLQYIVLGTTGKIQSFKREK